MAMAHTLNDVRAYWNEYVNDIEVTEYPRGSAEFFEALEKYRYEKIDYLKDYVGFERYAGKKDPGIFVLDEVVGYLITVAWIAGPSPLTLVVGFFVFRFFDVFKPRLARRLERIPGGDGILLDDVVAGLYGLVLVMLPARLLIDAPWNWTGGL